MVRDATLSKQQLEAASASERDALLAEAFDLSSATLAALSVSKGHTRWGMPDWFGPMSGVGRGATMQRCGLLVLRLINNSPS